MFTSMNYLTWELYLNIVETIVLTHLLFCKRKKEVKSKTKKQFYWRDALRWPPTILIPCKVFPKWSQKSQEMCAQEQTQSLFFLSIFIQVHCQTPLEGETLSVPPLFLSRMLSDSPLKPHFLIKKLTKIPPALTLLPVGPRAASLNPESRSLVKIAPLAPGSTSFTVTIQNSPTEPSKE